MPVIIRIANKKNLTDLPSARKIHEKPVPSLGGIGIFFGFIASAMILLFDSGINFYQEISGVFVASLMIFLLGVKDDVSGVRPSRKILIQFLAVSILIFKHDLLIKSFYGLFGLNEISMASSILLTYLTVVLIVNAYNLIDGVDGLAILLGALSSLLFGILFYVAKEHAYTILAFASLGSFTAFYFYNRQPAKIFMGDTGALLIGLLCGVFAVKLIEIVGSDQLSEFASVEEGPLLAMAILFVPVFDAFRVFVFRLLRKKSPFAAENNHIHHVLISKGLTHRQVTYSLLLFNILVFSIVWIGKSYLDVTTLFFLMIGVGAVFVYSSNRIFFQKL